MPQYSHPRMFDLRLEAILSMFMLMNENYYFPSIFWNFYDFGVSPTLGFVHSLWRIFYGFPELIAVIFKLGPCSSNP
jgi:hypothetical protein